MTAGPGVRVRMAGMPSHLAPWAARRPAWPALAWVGLWAAGLLLPSAVTVGAVSRPWLAGAGLLLVAVLFGLAAVPALLARERRDRNLWPVVAGQAAVTAALAAVPGLDLGALPVLLAIGVGVGAAVRWVPALVTATAVAAVVAAHAQGASWSSAGWGVGLTTLLAGLLTHAFAWLGVVIADLRCAREELAVAAVEEERARFARDLHDLLGHTLSVIVVKAQAARRYAHTDPEATAAHAADIEAIGREALTEVRQAVRGYRAPTLDAELSRAVRALEAAGIEADVVRGHQGLGPAGDEMLGWVVREGVTNVIRHARARHTVISTSSGPQGNAVVIEDDGVGPGADPDGGSGLAGLRERAQRAGGMVEAGGDGSGFRLSAVVPVAPGGTAS